MVVEFPAVIDDAPSVSVGADGTGKIVASVAVDMGEVPFRLLQVRIKVWVPTAVGTMVTLPLVACAPLQAPDAAQLVSFPDDQ
jgi:hypothetical protein